MTPTIFDLNDYDLVESMKDADLIIQPKKAPNGNQGAPVMWRLKEELRKKKRKEKPKVTVGMLDNNAAPVWTPHIVIDVLTTPQDYKRLIDWWFTEANKKENVDFFTGLEAQFFSVDVPEAVKYIRNSIEDYHTYKSVTDSEGNIEYTARIKDVGKKITTMLMKYKRENKFVKKK